MDYVTNTFERLLSIRTSWYRVNPKQHSGIRPTRSTKKIKYETSDTHFAFYCDNAAGSVYE